MSAGESSQEAAGNAAAEHLSPAFPDRAAWGTASKLRAWQVEALTKYFETEPRDFLAAATPGAGKTTFALRLATELLARNTVDRIVVVAPTEHLKRQWADAADRVGIRLDPMFKNGDGMFGRHYQGIAITYAQVGMNPEVHRRITEGGRTLVVLDEVHHGGDALTWGDGIREAFGAATRRLSLSGTPFRSDTNPIPFVSYAPDDEGIRTSIADYSYGYGRALQDGVVRPVLFMAYAGQMRWKTRMGDEMSASLGEQVTKDITAQAWRTALAPDGEWMTAVLSAADKRLTEVRRGVPDAGGLVIATDTTTARAYARILQRITGERPTVVLSDEAAASSRIGAFAADETRWMVAVRMVSEGVDVPRLCVGVYATSASTPLFFAQVIGRFVRARRRGETASVFLPSVPGLMALAASLELERDHALDRPKGTDDGMYNPEDAMVAEANQDAKASDSLLDLQPFQALDSQASFDRVLYDGGEFGSGGEIGSLEELDFIGIPGLLEPDQVRELLRQRQATQAKRARRGKDGQPRPPEPEHRPMYMTIKEQRSELHRLVSIWARHSNEPHGAVHAELRRISGGPAVAQASTEQIQKRIDILRSRIGNRR
ncbi:ATP-dependent helicase [Curtobacterium sp. MCBD17_034]|uniref:DEAD/DEAH box helicase n=1 Tax=unclassified Curtobacterium TaxID=257496 RepID=UPI000DA8106D|nr:MULTISPECIES: DEAD/DEAH box helicase [unclassified Curtobacterium]PZF59213.1 ATP-dependent helicase [Curtobacterium sp. MCBD17_034]PZF65126.1 ATP-dependent helicase [Curtobacterium sp. MCBD17_013]PZM34245.1 ATP-dependent helicase [Curtobacterium sp. MCBD17_031]WIE53214.1 DEAD/DEAH box helicase [Curtobacterium sp. MCBD17_003]